MIFLVKCRNHGSADFCDSFIVTFNTCWLNQCFYVRGDCPYEELRIAGQEVVNRYTAMWESFLDMSADSVAMKQPET